MKICIAGSRSIERIDEFTISSALVLIFGLDQQIDKEHVEIVQGGCLTGADFAAKVYAYVMEFNNTEFKADWHKNGKAAGPIRNREMAKYSDCLVLIWDGESRGSKNCKEEFTKLNKPVYEIILKGF